jgi:hypothetical protein
MSYPGFLEKKFFLVESALFCGDGAASPLSATQKRSSMVMKAIGERLHHHRT